MELVTASAVRLWSLSLKCGAALAGVLVLTALLVLVLVLIAQILSPARRLVNKLPGPPPMPAIGNMLEINVGHDEQCQEIYLQTAPSWRNRISKELFTRLSIMPLMWGGLGITRAWQASQPYVFVFTAQTAEPILNSSKHINKSYDYTYLHPWLGTGLLTSAGHKWHSRRKILTPTFHFRILEDFLDVFREQSNVLVQRMQREMGNSGFNLFPYVTLCTLDIICETAMGRQINAQENSDSEYVKAVYKMGEIIQSRQSRLWLQPSWLFRLSELHEAHERCIRILHNTSNKVIRERKAEIAAQQEAQDTRGHDETDEPVIGKKKRLAFLDLLIAAARTDIVLTDEDIREEVDTFMFEGHDTTSAAICWCLFLLGSDPEIQDRAYAEVRSVLTRHEGALTMKALNELRYLECCIKEALRLYPSVPLMGRLLQEDLSIAGNTVPAGTTAIIMTYLLHRDPTMFANPEKFDPDRFLPDNVQGRHPYAYIPFSAGPRNCIGQKFALLEEKSVIATVLSHYKITSVDRRDNLMLLGELILRPKNGLSVRIEPREPLPATTLKQNNI